MPKKKHKKPSKKRKSSSHNKHKHPLRDFIKSEIISIKEKEKAIEEEFEEKLKRFPKFFHHKKNKHSEKEKLETKNPFSPLFKKRKKEEVEVREKAMRSPFKLLLNKKEKEPKEETTFEPDDSFEDLEKQIKDLVNVFEEAGQPEQKKEGIFSKFGFFKKKKSQEPAEEKETEPIQEKEKVTEKIKEIKQEVKETPNPEKKIEKESRKFVKCLGLIRKSNAIFHSGDAKKAKRAYTKARKVFTKLSHEEKEKIHGDLVNLYNNLSK